MPVRAALSRVFRPSSPLRGTAYRALLVLAAALVALLAGCGARAFGPGHTGSLLEGRTPRSHGVLRPTALADGFASEDGGDWSSDLTSVFAGPDASIVFDLGERRPIRAAWLQADNNDVYELDVSDDGVEFHTAWSAGPVGGAGLRPRSTDSIDASGRFVRLRARGGDGSYAIAEALVWSERSEPFPPPIPRKNGAPRDEQIRSQMLVFGFALAGAVLLSLRRSPRWWKLLVALGPIVAAWRLGAVLAELGPAGGREVALARGIAGFVAAVALLWEAFAPPRLAPSRKVSLAVLGVCGVAGVLAFYNLGQPQFFDHKSGARVFTHHWDLRQYYATAKYFPEIGFFRMYEADVAAFAEDQQRSLDSLASQPMRDLYTNHMTTVAARRGAIEEVKHRFSPERWESYKRDAAYFRATMGPPAWLDTLADLGGNATPVWMSLAHVMFGSFQANDRAFAICGLLDPLLFLALFVAVGRTFGLRIMFATMVVFGANDFIMFGTNWAGATLRHDWLVYLGLGACALRVKRFRLGGVLLALATAIRAFPLFALAGVGLPAAWWLVERTMKERRVPRLGEIVKEQRDTVRVLVAAAATLVVLVVVSSAVLGAHSWIAWWAKVNLLDADAHVNPVSLRTVLAGSGPERLRVLAERTPMYWGALAAFFVLVCVAARKKPLEQAALYGLMLVQMALFPANYYAHLVCLLPMLAVDRLARGAKGDEAAPDEGDGLRRSFGATDAWVLVTLAAMCAAQYFTVLVSEQRLHFYLSSVTLVAAYASMLLAVVRRDAFPALAAAAVEDRPRQAA